MRKNQKLTKRPCYATTWQYLTCLLTLRPQRLQIYVFVECFSFIHFLATYSFFWNLKLSSLKCELKFGHTTQIFASRCTSLLLRSKPVQINPLRFFPIFKKTVHPVKVNKTKVTSKNAFLGTLFELEMTVFRDCPRMLDWSLNPWTTKEKYIWFCGVF